MLSNICAQGTPLNGEPILIRFLHDVHSSDDSTGVVIPPKRMRKLRRRMRQKLKKQRARAERAAEARMKLQIMHNN